MKKLTIIISLIILVVLTSVFAGGCSPTNEIRKNIENMENGNYRLEIYSQAVNGVTKYVREYDGDKTRYIEYTLSSTFEDAQKQKEIANEMYLNNRGARTDVYKLVDKVWSSTTVSTSGITFDMDNNFAYNGLKLAQDDLDSNYDEQDKLFKLKDDKYKAVFGGILGGVCTLVHEGGKFVVKAVYQGEKCDRIFVNKINGITLKLPQVGA